jgi:hypothetical protein
MLSQLPGVAFSKAVACVYANMSGITGIKAAMWAQYADGTSAANFLGSQGSTVDIGSEPYPADLSDPSTFSGNITASQTPTDIHDMMNSGKSVDLYYKLSGGNGLTTIDKGSGTIAIDIAIILPLTFSMQAGTMPDGTTVNEVTVDSNKYLKLGLKALDNLDNADVDFTDLLGDNGTLTSAGITITDIKNNCFPDSFYLALKKTATDTEYVSNSAGSRILQLKDGAADASYTLTDLKKMPSFDILIPETDDGSATLSIPIPQSADDTPDFDLKISIFAAASVSYSF